MSLVINVPVYALWILGVFAWFLPAMISLAKIHSPLDVFPMLFAIGWTGLWLGLALGVALS